MVADVDEGMGHPVRGAANGRRHRHGPLRHRVPRLLARRRRRQGAQHEPPQRREGARAIQKRGLDVQEDAPRKRHFVHGGVHAAPEAGHRDEPEQGDDPIHAPPPEEGQVQHEQNDRGGAADLAGTPTPSLHLFGKRQLFSREWATCTRAASSTKI